MGILVIDDDDDIRDAVREVLLPKPLSILRLLSVAEEACSGAHRTRRPELWQPLTNV